MIRVVQKFQNSLTEAERLLSEQEEIKRRAAAEQKAAVNRMADEFEGKVGRFIGMLSSSSTELEATAPIHDRGCEPEQLAGGCCCSAAAASTGMQTVASASEELAASIRREEQDGLLSPALDQFGGCALNAPLLRPGAIAQLGERLNGIQEVRGSTPLGSTTEIKALDSCDAEYAKKCPHQVPIRSSH